jgi:predicted DNA-binding transcriptional regulator AlpA
MKMTEVMKMVSLPRSGILRRVREGTFPAYEIKNKYMFWSRKQIVSWKNENENKKVKN